MEWFFSEIHKMQCDFDGFGTKICFLWICSSTVLFARMTALIQLPCKFFKGCSEAPGIAVRVVGISGSEPNSHTKSRFWHIFGWISITIWAKTWFCRVVVRFFARISRHLVRQIFLRPSTFSMPASENAQCKLEISTADKGISILSPVPHVTPTIVLPP